MALSTDAKFEGKLTLAFKNDMTNFSPAHLKDSNLDVYGILLSKAENV